MGIPDSRFDPGARLLVAREALNQNAALGLRAADCCVEVKDAYVARPVIEDQTRLAAAD